MKTNGAMLTPPRMPLAIHLDVRLIAHPKIQRAGLLLGSHGIARAYTMFANSIAYAREFLTDGYIPASFVDSFPGETDPIEVAKVLSHQTVKLWHRQGRHGYLIHDYLDYNRKACIVKGFREKERVRQHAYREARKQAEGRGQK